MLHLNKDDLMSEIAVFKNMVETHLDFNCIKKNYHTLYFFNCIKW